MDKGSLTGTGNHPGVRNSMVWRDAPHALTDDGSPLRYGRQDGCFLVGSDSTAALIFFVWQRWVVNNQER